MITVRKANADDVPRILEIFNESVSPPWTPRSIQSELDKDDTLFLVAVNTNDHPPHVLGLAVVRQVGDDGELLQIATCPYARRKGVGNALMNAVLDFSFREKHGALHLEVRVGNIAAVNLYEKYGFKKVRTRANYYNEPVEDALIMVRSISEC